MRFSCRPPTLALRLAVLLALGAAAAVPALAQRFPTRPKQTVRAAMRHLVRSYRTAPARGALATVTETEPNDSMAVADTVSLGDTVSAAIDPLRDVDYFALSVPAGTRLDLDVDAYQIGSPLDAVMALFLPDGSMVAYSDDADGVDPHIRYTVSSTGPAHYIIGVTSYDGSGGSLYTYKLKIGTAPTGPGDPTTLFASGLGYPYAMAAGATGQLFVADPNSNTIYQVGPSGAVATYAALGSGYGAPGYFDALAVDGTGDLLGAGADSLFNGGAIFRFSGAGSAPQRLAHTNAGYFYALTIGPDGDLWAATIGWLFRYDPVGILKDSVGLGGTDVTGLAFTPGGDLLISNGYDAVLRLKAGGSVVDTVIRSTPYLETLALDRDGYLYVSNGYLGEVYLYDPTYQKVGAVFASTNLGGPISLAFGRASDGSMTSRLFAANGGYGLVTPYAGGVVEMNPAGMRAPGLRIGVDLLRVAASGVRSGVIGESFADTLRLANPPAGQVTWSLARGQPPTGITLAATGILSGVPEDSGAVSFSVRADVAGQYGYGAVTISVTVPTVSISDAANHLLGGGILTPERERYLDLVGNHNGRYDVGDFRAFLRSRGQLPLFRLAAPTARKEKP